MAKSKKNSTKKGTAKAVAATKKATTALNLREHTREGKIAWFLILAMIVIVPIIIGNGPLNWMGMTFVDGFDGVKVFVLRVGVMAIMAAWVWDVVRNGGEIRYHCVYILIGVFIAWILLTTVLSISPATAFLGKYRRYDGAWSFMLYAMLLFFTMQYATSRARIRQLAHVFSLASVFVAGYGLLQALPNPFRTPGEGIITNWDPLTWGALPFEPFRSFSTYGNPDLLAGFLSFSIFVILGLLFSEKEQKWRRFYCFALLLNSAVAVTAFARSLWVAFAVTIIIFIIMMIYNRVKPQREDYYFAGGIAAVVTAFIAFSLTRADVVMNFWIRLVSIFEFGEGSALTRFQIWDAALQAIADRPIFGFGLDTFRLIFRHYAPPEYAQAAGFRSVADNVHNFPLQLATGIGIVGVILFYAILFWIAFLAIRRCLKRGEGPASSGRILTIGIICGCIAYNVSLMFGLALPGTSFILWILMGCLLIPFAKTVQVNFDKNKLAIPIAILLSVVLMIPTVFATRLALADIAYANPAGLVAAGVGQADMTTLRSIKQDAERTVRLNPFYERYYLDYFVILTHYTLVNMANGAPGAPALLEESKQAAVHLVDMSPWEYDSYLAVATFYLNLAQIVEPEEGVRYTEEAIDFMRDKIERTPTGLALRQRYAEALLNLGEVEAAREQLVFVVEHDTNHTVAAEMLETLDTNPAAFPTLTP